MQWQFDIMLKWGNDRAISIDATFCTNHIKYHLFTLFDFDDFRHGMSIASIITSRQKENDLMQWLMTLRLKAINIVP